MIRCRWVGWAWSCSARSVTWNRIGILSTAASDERSVTWLSLFPLRPDRLDVRRMRSLRVTRTAFIGNHQTGAG